MEYYRPIMSYVTITCLVLACIVVVASLYESRKAYRIALGCYSVIALVAAFQALVPHILGIQMANAFNSSRKVPVTGYILPLLTLVGFIYPALSLYPFMSGRSGRIVAFTFAGLSVVFAIGSFVAEAVRWPLTQNGGMYYQPGLIAIFYLLLWLRVYDLRAASETA
jgi:hypothetical protein